MSFVYFTDRDLGNAFPTTLEAHGLTVERHAAHLRHDCPDEEWLELVGRRGWVAVTRDTRIRYKPNELAAVVRHRVTMLVLIGKATHPQLATNFVRTEARIRAFLARHEPPLIGKVYRPSAADPNPEPEEPGSVALWYPKIPK